MNDKSKTIFGKPNGRIIAAENNPNIHKSQWYPEKHPGTSQVPYLINQVSISEHENTMIREIWNASEYSSRDFSVFDIKDVPSKYRLAQVLACGLKATNATYSQHWQGMYFDWTCNSEVKDAIDLFGIMPGSESFVKNAISTVVLINTGYKGAFMNMLKWRRRPLPPSMLSLENIDMGTFENNLKSAICSVLGGEYGVNIIRRAFSDEYINSYNKEGYQKLKDILTLDGMNPKGEIATIMQIGLKQPEDRKYYQKKIMNLAGAKLIERKSERRNVDFNMEIPERVMDNFFKTVRNELQPLGIENIVKSIILEGSSNEGKEKLSKIRDMITDSLDKVPGEMIDAYEANVSDGMVDLDRDKYTEIANLTASLGKKVLKPREDAHKMVFMYIEIDKLKELNVAEDAAEHAVGCAIQAGLNSIHLDGTTDIPEGDDLRYGAFCLTGPIHSAEINDSDEQLNRGYGHGFWDIIAPELSPTNKMLGVIAISAKHEQDAMIAEKQSMEQRKSVNDIFWYKTWNHPEGKRLDVPNWISYAEVLNVLPIPGNDIILKKDNFPDQLPANHPITETFKRQVV